MNVKDFLHKELESISKDFPQVQIKYSFNKIINTHIIVLLPLEEYQNNAALDDAWIPLSFKFRASFPDEEIAFVSSDSSLSKDDAVFEFNVISRDIDLIADLFTSFSEEEFNYTFPTCMPIGAITIGTSISGILDYPKERIHEEYDIDTFYQAAA